MRDAPCFQDGIFQWLTATFFLWFILAIYFDNTLPYVNGVKNYWFYFSKLSYWTGKTSDQVEVSGWCSCTRYVPPLSESSHDGEGVATVESLVRQQVTDNTKGSNVVVQVCGLLKTFPGIRNMVGFCRCIKKDPNHAVNGLWINIEKDKLLCLLVPNGAGKTTTINLLIGITPITVGDAPIYGDSIKSTSGMSNI